MKSKLDKAFWDERYLTGQTGWNIGYPSTPLKEYFDQLEDKNLKILIPGCGNSYEAEYLFKNGFTNVYIADISPYPLKNFSERVPEFPKNHLLHTDFFEIDDEFDLIIEQTFFCTMNPPNRMDYADKIYELLRSGGKLVGLLFTFPLVENGPPPYGGNTEEYKSVFSKNFDLRIMETAYNSIPPRAGNEVFFMAVKE